MSQMVAFQRKHWNPAVKMNCRKKNTIIPQSNASIDHVNFEKFASVPSTKVYYFLVYLHGVFIAPILDFLKICGRSLYQTIQLQEFVRATTPWFYSYSSFQALFSLCFALVYGRRPVNLFAALSELSEDSSVHLSASLLSLSYSFRYDGVNLHLLIWWPKASWFLFLVTSPFKNQETIWCSLWAWS